MGLIRSAADSAPLRLRDFHGRLCSLLSDTSAWAESAPAVAPSEAATAQPTTLEAYIAAFLALDRHEIAALALTLGILCFAVVTAILLVRTRARLAETEAAARDEGIASKAAVDRAYALLLAEPQILIAWAAASDEPEIIGDPALVTGSDEPHRVLAFGTWLDADRALEMERSVDALRARGVSFAMTVTTLTGRVIEAEGQIVGGRAILRLREVTGARYELAELTLRHQKQIDDTAALQALIDALPSPVWARDDAGKLIFVNAAYAGAVEVKNRSEAVERGIELFGGTARTEIFGAHESAKAYTGRLPAVVAGHRRTFDVIAVPAAHGSAGIGIDATEAETLRGELARMIDAHRRTLDQLADRRRDLRRPIRSSASTTPPTGRSGTSTPPSSTRDRPTRPCSISCAPPASFPTNRTSASGRPRCTKPIARSRPRSSCGTCRAAAPCGS